METISVKQNKKRLKVKDVYDIIDTFAPFDTQEDWDNSGLLAGSADREVHGILCALDMLEGVIDEAVRKNCDLIVTHHPILFHARKNITEDDPEGRLLAQIIKSGMSHIAAHTNFDIAPNGVNDALARDLELRGISVHEDGMRSGLFDGDISHLAEMINKALGGYDRIYGNTERRALRAAVMGGAGGSYWKTAKSCGADVFITGEIKHSDALDAVSDGLVVIQAGHDRTERNSVKALQSGLQRSINALKYDLQVQISDYVLF